MPRVKKKRPAMPGAGRPENPPHLKPTPLPAKVPKYIKDHLDEMPGSNNQLIQMALIKFYKIKKP